MKKWYLSRTLWTNAIAIVGIIATDLWGVEIGAEEAVALLAVVNMVLRFITNKQLTS